MSKDTLEMAFPPVGGGVKIELTKLPGGVI